METVIITPDDLAPFATIEASKAEAMINDATATARRIAPCLKDTVDDDVIAGAKALLRAAILRWNDAGTGAIQQQVSGPYSTMYMQTGRKSMFWPSEITELQQLCTDSDAGKAFSVDTAPSLSPNTDDGYWSDTTTWTPYP